MCYSRQELYPEYQRFCAGSGTLVPTMQNESRMELAHAVSGLMGEERELRELQSFIVGSKHACSLLQRETLSFSSKVVQVFWDFPGGSVVRTLPSNAGVAGLIPGWGAKIPRALWPKNQTIKEKQYCNKFNKDFKNSPHQKKKILKKKKRSCSSFLQRLFAI